MLMMMPTTTTTTAQRMSNEADDNYDGDDDDETLSERCGTDVQLLWLGYDCPGLAWCPIPIHAWWGCLAGWLAALVAKKSTIIHLHNVRKVSGRRQRTKECCFLFFFPSPFPLFFFVSVHGAFALRAEAAA